MAGPCEFLKNKGKPVKTDKLQLLTQLYNLMPYDMGMLSHFEKSALDKAQITLPNKWEAATNKIQLKTIPTQAGLVGIILFPELADKNELLKHIASFDNSLQKFNKRKDLCLLVGISPWGQQIEQVYLEKATTPPHILLGSGPGSGIRGNLVSKRHTFWVRPYAKGKAVHRIEINKLPQQNPEGKWQTGKGIRSSLLVLADNVHSDPQALKLINAHSKK